MLAEMPQEMAQHTWKHLCVMLMVTKQGGTPLPEFAGDWAPVSRAGWDDKIYEVTMECAVLGRGAEAPQFWGLLIWLEPGLSHVTWVHYDATMCLACLVCSILLVLHVL